MSTRVVNLRRESYDVYIGRPSMVGNPFPITQSCTRNMSVRKYREWFDARIRQDAAFRSFVLSLRGKRLGCFCKPDVCHGDVIVEWLENN